MPKFLLVDTTTTLCSIAISFNNEIVVSQEFDGDFKHAELISKFVETCCIEASITLKDIDAFVLSKGPGSYTGLRIGTSFLKGICYALQKPLIAIDTLEAMAYHIASTKNEDALYCAMIDAKRMEVYAHMLDKNKNTVRNTQADVVDENTYDVILQKNKVYFFGNGAEKCMSILTTFNNACFIDDVKTNAKNMLPLALNAFEKSIFEDVAYFEPFYLKDFFIGVKAKI